MLVSSGTKYLLENAEHAVDQLGHSMFSGGIASEALESPKSRERREYSLNDHVGGGFVFTGNLQYPETANDASTLSLVPTNITSNLDPPKKARVGFDRTLLSPINIGTRQSASTKEMIRTPYPFDGMKTVVPGFKIPGIPSDTCVINITIRYLNPKQGRCHYRLTLPFKVELGPKSASNSNLKSTSSTNIDDCFVFKALRDEYRHVVGKWRYFCVCTIVSVKGSIPPASLGSDNISASTSNPHTSERDDMRLRNLFSSEFSLRQMRYNPCKMLRRPELGHSQYEWVELLRRSKVSQQNEVDFTRDRASTAGPDAAGSGQDNGGLPAFTFEVIHGWNYRYICALVGSTILLALVAFFAWTFSGAKGSDGNLRGPQSRIATSAVLSILVQILGSFVIFLMLAVTKYCM